MSHGSIRKRRATHGTVLLALILALGIPAQAQAHSVDVSVALTAPEAVRNGDGFAYSYAVTNPNREYSANDVVLTSRLPDGVSFEPSPGCTHADGLVTCNIGVIPRRRSSPPAVNVVTGQINVRATRWGRVTTSVTVTNDWETRPADNTASATTDVRAVADLSIEQSASKDPIVAGDVFDYLFTIHNSGPDPANGVVLHNTLPSGISFVSSDDCTEAGGQITCQVGDVESGQTTTRRITVVAERSGDGGGSATVDSSTDDPEVINNSTPIATVVGESAKPQEPVVQNTELPDPVTGQLALASPSQGNVLIRTPVETDFRRLDQTEAIPIGSELDTRAGKVTIITTRNRRGSSTQSAKFYDGRFQLRQSDGKKPLTTARLSGELEGCTGAGLDPAAKGKTKNKKGRSLFGSGSGRFRTSGNSGSATVRGTTWLVEDRCDGSTFIRVDSSRIKPPKTALEVDDFGKPGKNDVGLAVGESYLAR